MAELFVSYKSDDRQRATLVAEALVKEGFDVWWDPALSAGEDYQEVIDRNLREALVVIVLWSQKSVKSRWVRSEATVGDQYGALAPAKIAKCDLPTAFVLVQTADLSEWNGDPSDLKWREFVGDVRAKRDRRRATAATSAPPPPDSNLIESIFWQSIADSGEVADFESYLTRYPHGHFVDLARRRRDKLLAGAAPPIAPAPVRRTAAVTQDEPAEHPRPAVSKMVLAGGAALALAFVGGGVWYFGSQRDHAATAAAETAQVQAAPAAGSTLAPPRPAEVASAPAQPVEAPKPEKKWPPWSAQDKAAISSFFTGVWSDDPNCQKGMFYKFQFLSGERVQSTSWSVGLQPDIAGSPSVDYKTRNRVLNIIRLTPTLFETEDPNDLIAGRRHQQRFVRQGDHYWDFENYYRCVGMQAPG